MPRDSSGTYTLPPTNPVVDGTLIETVWANGTLNDIAAQLNNVLTRDGLLGPVDPFLIVDGTSALPGLAFASQPGTGLWRNSTQAGFSYAGVASVVWDAAKVTFNKPLYLPAAAPTDDNQATNKKYVDDAVSTGGFNGGTIDNGIQFDATAWSNGEAAVNIINGDPAESYWGVVRQQGAREQGVLFTPTQLVIQQSNAAGTAEYTLALNQDGNLYWRGSDLGKWAPLVPTNFAGGFGIVSADVPATTAWSFISVSVPSDTVNLAWTNFQNIGSANGVFNFEGLRVYTSGKEFRIGGTDASVGFNGGGQQVFRNDAQGLNYFGLNTVGLLSQPYPVASMSSDGLRYTRIGPDGNPAGWPGIHFFWAGNNQRSIAMSSDGVLNFASNNDFTSIANTFSPNGNIWSAGNITAFSDARYKTNLVARRIDLDIAAQELGVYNYDRTDQERHDFGGLAQELQVVLPECVIEQPDGKLSMDYGRAAYALVVSLLKERAHGTA